MGAAPEYQIQHLLNYPLVLRTWANNSYNTDFCYGGGYKTASAFVECYGNSVTQLHIMGLGVGVPPLPKTSSIDASRTTRCRVRCRSPSGTWGCCGRWCSCATTSPDLSAARTEGGQRRDERQPPCSARTRCWPWASCSSRRAAAARPRPGLWPAPSPPQCSPAWPSSSPRGRRP